jgi:hypothetical protein
MNRASSICHDLANLSRDSSGSGRSRGLRLRDIATISPTTMSRATIPITSTTSVL